MRFIIIFLLIFSQLSMAQNTKPLITTDNGSNTCNTTRLVVPSGTVSCNGSVATLSNGLGAANYWQLNNVGIGTSTNVGIGTLSPQFPLQVNSGTFTLGTGGNITTYSSAGVTYTVHTFTGSGTFVAPSPITTVNVLVVGGGGGGGEGGGGAGDYNANASYAVTALQSISVTVGTGGAGSGAQPGGGTPGNGTSSVFGSITSIGGGGSNSNGNNGQNGGSGGGAAAGSSVQVKGSATGNNGHDGGVNFATTPYPSGAGGGAGAVGTSPANQTANMPGGVGLSNSISGSAVFYAGGGGGDCYQNGGGCGTGIGGNGGGGNGSAGTGNGTNGTANTGGGGGGGCGALNGTGGTGGSGVVIVSYAVPAAQEAIYANGSVGINNIAPTGLLSITGVGNDSSTTSLMINNSALSTTLNLNDAGSLYVKSNVGIGTLNPGQLLDVNGNIRTISTNSHIFGSDNSVSIAATAASSGGLQINTNSLPRVTVVNGGNVGIGSATPGVALDVNGVIRSGTTCLYKCVGGVDAGVIQTSACNLCPAGSCTLLNNCA